MAYKAVIFALADGGDAHGFLVPNSTLQTQSRIEGENLWDMIQIVVTKKFRMSPGLETHYTVLVDG